MRWITIFVVLTLLASACSGDDDGDTQQGTGTITTNPDGTPSETGDDLIVTTGGLDVARSAVQVRLSEGTAFAPTTPAAPVAVVEGEPLGTQQVETLLAELPELVTEDGDESDFERPPESLRPPRAGTTISETFPAEGDGPPDAPPVESGPLEVLRVQPDGEVGLAPLVSITFNQPMVPIGTLGQLDDENVPAILSPAVDGRWMWIGTRTLRFEANPDLYDRLPQATEFRVTIPSGTTSATGGRLSTAVSFDFATPAVEVESISPQSNESLPLTPVFVARFNQRVDAAKILAVTTMTADGEAVDLRLATEQEIDADERVRGIIGSALDGRWVAFRAVTQLKPDTQLQITVGPNLPSAEGPRIGQNPLTVTNRTYPPLELRDAGCGGDCQPFEPFSLRFSNPLDPLSFTSDMISISPTIPGAAVAVQGNSITISGGTTGRTTYDITIDGALTDVFEQTLGSDVTTEVRVGRADQLFAGPNREIITLDPLAGTPGIGYQSINTDHVDVKVYEVQPEDWNSYREWSQQYWNAFWDEDRRAPNAPWNELMSERTDIDGPEDALIETTVDLSDAVSESQRHVVIVAEPKGMNRDNYRTRPSLVWAQYTDIGIDVISDGEDMLVWTTRLSNGEPIPNVEVDFLDRDLRTRRAEVTTGSSGTAIVAAPGNEEARMALATTDGDSAILPDGYWRSNPRRDSLIWYVIDDRGLYRPGETVSVKGWVRNLDLNGAGQLQQWTQDSTSFSVHDSRGNDIGSGTTEISALGGFDFTFDLPAGSNLGMASLNVGSGGHHAFQIQEFRRPEFEVTTDIESEGPHFIDDSTTVKANASYFSGGPLPDAPVDWAVTTRSATYNPPGWSDYVFGTWTPWWFVSDPFFGGGFGGGFAEDVAFGDDIGFGPGFPQGDQNVVQYQGRTNAAGDHFLQLDFGPAREGEDVEPEPVTVTATATVTDVNRQAWSDETNVLVHPADVYVGVRSTTSFVRPGETIDFDLVATTIDGDRVTGQTITVDFTRLEWQNVGGEWKEVGVESTRCEVESTNEDVRCSFTPTTGGSYEVKAIVLDELGRANATTMTRWVSGGQARPNRRVEQEQVDLIPNQETYAPGDTAEILVVAPFADAHGVLTITRNGIEDVESFSIEGSSTILEIPIEKTHVPNLSLQVDLAGSTPRTSARGAVIEGVPDRPAFAVGRLDLSIPPTRRILSLDVDPSKDEAKPGDSLGVSVVVTDADDAPVSGAEVAIIVVDEAVLSLTNYELTDPTSVFYANVNSWLESIYSRNLIRLTNPDELKSGADGENLDTVDEAMAGDDSGADLSADAAAPEAARLASGAVEDSVALRSNFDALALFSPETLTDASGKVQVDLDLPDNLTRYRVMVVAVDGAERFGSGESNLTAALPLQVRPSMPRFLNFGDSAELPVVLQNRTDESMTVDIALAATNLELDSAGRRVTVPANNRVEVRFPASTELAGTARYQVIATTGAESDAALGSFPVYTPATTEAFATYGALDSGAVAQPLLSPVDVFPQFGGLEINTSSTAVQALTDAVLYLHDYRYESSDAYASRIMAITSLDDVLEAFDADGLPSPAVLRARVADDISALRRLQNGDGGFGYWRRDGRSNPWNSIQAGHALAIARKEGFDVDRQVTDQLGWYLQNIESYYEDWYSEQTRYALSSYAVYVRHLFGDTDVGKAESLYAQYGRTSLEAAARLWMVIGSPSPTADDIQQYIANSVDEEAGSVTFTTNVTEDAWVILHSDLRTDAIVLEALIDQTPDSTLIPKVVTGLIGNQTRGRWNNVQENSFILIAMDRYFNTFESVTPDFVARVWLGDTYAAEHEFRGRTTVRRETVVPMTEVVAGGDGDIIISKDGDGRLYYRLGLKYAPTDLELDPLDRGFVVQRVYEAVNDEDDVVRNSDGSWTIKAGAEVRVRLTMVADGRHNNMALVDPLPAGLEPVNPALSASADPPIDPFARESSWWWWTWYEHQQLRDDRAEVFSTWLWAGTHEYTYVARATTPGEFVVPPAKAEEIYAPEVFGRSASDRVIIR